MSDNHIENSNSVHENTLVIKSRMGAAFGGSHAIFRGHNLHTELNHMSWVELYLFGITGRRFTPEQLRLVEAMWLYTSYPDVRLWNNRVAGLAGSTRSTGNLGLTISLAISEGSIFGRGIDIEAITFIINTYQNLKNGKTLEECVNAELKMNRRIAGFARPMTQNDERNGPILLLVKELNLEGPHLSLAMEVDHFLWTSRRRMKINYGGLAAALCADLGLSPQEYYLLAFPTFLAGTIPCFIEASKKTEGILFRTSCADIAYEGPARRAWVK